MVMRGSADNASQWGRQVAQPDEIDMRETQSPCVIVADTDAHYARAKDAGATIVMDIADQDYGGRGHSRRDIQGHPGRSGQGRVRRAGVRPTRTCGSAAPLQKKTRENEKYLQRIIDIHIMQ